LTNREIRKANSQVVAAEIKRVRQTVAERQDRPKFQWKPMMKTCFQRTIVALALMVYLALAWPAKTQSTVTYPVPSGMVVVNPNGTVINEGGSICINGSSALLLGYETCTLIAGHRAGPLALQGSDGSTGQLYVGAQFIINDSVDKTCTAFPLWNRTLLPSGSYEITMDCDAGSGSAADTHIHVDWVAHLQSYKVCTRSGCQFGTEWVGNSGTVTLSPIPSAL